MKILSILMPLLLATIGCGAPITHHGHHEVDASLTSARTVASENRIRNFHTVHTTLYRSGGLRPDERADFDTLTALGIRSVLSLETDGDRTPVIRAEQAAASARGMNFFRVPMDGYDRPTVDQIERALRLIDDPENQPILVHCLHGSDRTGIVVAAYRMRRDGWSKDEAVREMKGLGHARNLYWWDSVLDDL